SSELAFKQIISLLYELRRVMNSQVAFVGNNASTALSVTVLHWKPASVTSHAAYSRLLNANEVQSGPSTGDSSEPPMTTMTFDFSYPQASCLLLKKKQSSMGKGMGEEWDEKPRETQPRKHEETERRSSGSKCPKCCLKTRDCLMSPECSRALQISQVVAMCGMCLRFFVCDPLWSSTDNVEEERNLLQQDQTPIEDEQDFKLFLL
ncbi:hypothetical protein ABVT39_023580, partial [Epinephelus coioides]